MFFGLHLKAEDIRSRHIYAGAGYALSGLQDWGISPLYYDGNHIFLNVGWQRGSKSATTIAEINFLNGRITPAINPRLTTAEMKNLKLNIHLSHYRLAGSIFNTLNLFLGGSALLNSGSYTHNHFINSSVTIFAMKSLNLNTRISVPLVINKKDHLMEFHLQSPFAAFIIRPSYAYIKPSGFLDHSSGLTESIFRSIEMATINRYFNLNSGISLKYNLNNKTAIRICYRWEYLEHSGDNPLTSVTHGIVVQTTLNL